MPPLCRMEMLGGSSYVDDDFTLSRGCNDWDSGCRTISKSHNNLDVSLELGWLSHRWESSRLDQHHADDLVCDDWGESLFDQIGPA